MQYSLCCPTNLAAVVWLRKLQLRSERNRYQAPYYISAGLICHVAYVRSKDEQKQ